MKIVIAGAGDVGSHLARLLSNEEQDIIVLDTNAKRLASLENYNLMTVQGSATSFETLKDVKIKGTDIFISVTPYETLNVISCSMAKKMGAKKTVARIDNYEFLKSRNRDFFTELGIDDLVYPEHLAAQEIQIALEHTWVRSWFEMFNGELLVIGVKLRKRAKLIGQRLRDLTSLSSFMHVCAIKRNHETLIPRGEDLILENDIIYIATTHKHLDEVVEQCGKEKRVVERVLIMGGNEIVVRLAKEIGEKYRVKILESDYNRCQFLAEELPYCNIVHYEPGNTDVLEEEHVEDYDVFAAMTNSSEANILSCLMAKEMGARKTIAEVENLQFINEAESLNIGTIINKKLIASSRIFQIMIDIDDDTSKCLALSDAEVAELEVGATSKVTKAPVKDLNLSRDMTIAGLVRDGVGHLVTGNTQLRAGDRVVVFCLSGAIHKIEKTFGK